MGVTVTARIEAQLAAAVWTSLGNDVLLPIEATWGIQGNGPTDVMAGTGELHFDLDNSLRNSGATLGWYSPAFSGKRSGWTFGIPVRLVLTYLGVDYVRFYGKVAAISPLPGRYQERRVHVVAYDNVYDLMQADARQTTVQINQSESTLITDVLAAIPSTAQPLATSLDAGLDTFRYTFDNVGPGSKAARVLKDLVVSSLGILFVNGDGTLTYTNRHSRAVAASSATFSNDMVALEVPSNLDGVYNRVRTTIHPKSIDAAATTVLFSLQGTPPLVSAGETVTIWGTYYNPTQTQQLIGGTSQVTPLVATTDYTANTASDGSGTDLTASVSVVATAFASTVKLAVTNNGALPAYLTKLQIRGKGIYDIGAQTFERYVAMSYGDLSLEIDMPYQADPEIGQSAADYVTLQYDNLAQQVSSMEFVANRSDTFMQQALLRKPGEVVTLSETVTGLSSVKAAIQRVGLRFDSRELRCTFGLAPAAPFGMWLIGVTGASEIGSTTVLGF